MRKLINNMLDTLFPKEKSCFLCGGKTNRAACELCIAHIRFLEEGRCLKCGKGIEDSYRENYCPDCCGKSHFFDRGYSCFEYSGVGKKLIYSYKYEGNLSIGDLLSDFMLEAIKKEALAFDVIVPVPIHENKLMQRGFNQAAHIAQKISEKTGKPMLEVLDRKKETISQYNLSKFDRIQNIVDAFLYNFMYNVDNKRILLIDDIFTTGSTANECSKVLKQHGAQAVNVLTAASGSNT